MKKVYFLLLTFFVMTLALHGQTRPRLAILPFTGGSGEDGETIAEFFSSEPEITRNFTAIPRTRAFENIMREQQFQRSGLTDSDTIAELGRQLNAEYVLAGHITSLGASNLLLITIVHVESFQQIAGDYREYRRIEETPTFLPDMARRIAAAARQDTSRLPRLAVLPFNVLSSGINQGDAEVLAQILATDIANSGRYAVFPRTKAIETVMAEHQIQRTGMTDPESIRLIGVAVNAQYVLSANVRSLGTDKYFSASILHIEGGNQEEGTYKRYQDVSDGLALMAELAGELTQPRIAGISDNFVRISGGTFTMGSPEDEPERQYNEVQHRVTLSGFYINKYEVTQREYQEIMGTNPSNYFKGENLPVDNVSWYDAIEFCNRLSHREGLTPVYTIDKTRIDPNNMSYEDTLKWLVSRNPNANGYRLPTEAEWEYACRAGTTTPFSTGNNITTDQANFNGNYPYNNNAKGVYRERITTVGSFAPNPWGLYDMHGNIEEWCWDWYGDYSRNAQTNPVGASSESEERVVRGGRYFDSADVVRSAKRSTSPPSWDSRYAYIVGFRLVRNAD